MSEPKPPEWPGLHEPIRDEKERMRDDPATLTRPLACQECRQEWTDPNERWRLYVTLDHPPEALVYCPACAIREFGD